MARPMDWGYVSPQPKLGIDVGDVLSDKSVKKADGAGLECILRCTKGVIINVNYT